jgi:hypothetical protein
MAANTSVLCDGPRGKEVSNYLAITEKDRDYGQYLHDGGRYPSMCPVVATATSSSNYSQ